MTPTEALIASSSNGSITSITAHNRTPSQTMVIEHLQQEFDQRGCPALKLVEEVYVDMSENKGTLKQDKNKRRGQTKFNPMRGVISGKRILVVDDSVVRSTTITRVIKMLRKAGAKEIHVRVASPPIKSTCHFGVDMATLNELIAANKTVTEITEYIGADSLAYLSGEGLLRAVRAPENSYCTGCFTGNYPIPVSYTHLTLPTNREV